MQKVQREGEEAARQAGISRAAGQHRQCRSRLMVLSVPDSF